MLLVSPLKGTRNSQQFDETCPTLVKKETSKVILMMKIIKALLITLSYLQLLKVEVNEVQLFFGSNVI